MPGSPKSFTLIGYFDQLTTAAAISVQFELPITFDLDDFGALAGLRLLEARNVRATVWPNSALVAGLLIGGLLLVGPAVGVVAVALLYAVCGTAANLLTNAVMTVLRHASLLRSPVSVPPGLFEAFGRFAPVTVSIDDLNATGVLHTPTTVWGVRPRSRKWSLQPSIDPRNLPGLLSGILPPVGTGILPLSPGTLPPLNPGDLARPGSDPVDDNEPQHPG